MMRATLIVVLVGCVALPAARGSPHADEVEELFSNLDGRYSNNVFEDAKLKVPELIRKYGYPAEVHTVTTEDGYILTMHRIPHGRDNNNDPTVVRPIVFLMHGILCSSADWVIMGPGTAFGYLLAEAGYDVWMGNARGTYYSRKHVRLNPDSLFSTAFWKFSWDEIGRLDVPAMIDYALDFTGQQRLHYVGHSQGTTTFFVMTSLRPDYNEKIISMHAFAPVAYMRYNRNPLLQFLAPYSTDIQKITSLMGIGEFFPNTIINEWAGIALCRDHVPTQEICSNILYLIGGFNECQHNATMMPAVFGHAPAGASVRQFTHYAQGITGKEFRRYDQGSIIANWRTYGSFRPPRYDLAKITAPVFLHYSEGDPLADVRDVDILFRELGRPIGKFRIPMTTFSHNDFIWGINANELLYDRAISLIRAMDVQGLDNNV